MLHGHERSITQIKYNRDGDLLFSVAKDAHPAIWYSENGERVGTFDGHNGAVWCVDVSCILDFTENVQGRIACYVTLYISWFVYSMFLCLL